MTDDQVQHASARGAGEGSLAEMVDAWPAQNTSQGNTRMGWIKFAVLAGLVIAFNYHQFVLMYQGWYHRNWTHGFLIPLFSAFLIYTHWGRLARVVAAPPYSAFLRVGFAVPGMSPPRR